MITFELEQAPIHRCAHVDWDSERWDGFVPRAGDIYVCTCQQSGTAWNQVIAALLVFQTPDLPQPLDENSPWLDLVTGAKETTHARLAAQTHRRVPKSHAPLDGLKWHESANFPVVAPGPA